MTKKKNQEKPEADSDLVPKPIPYIAVGNQSESLSEVVQTRELGHGDLHGGGNMDAGDIAAMNEERAQEIEHVDAPAPEMIFAPGSDMNLPVAALAETVILPRDVDPSAPIGTLNPAHRFFWRGNDINGREHVGSGDNASQCNVAAGLQGSSTCHLRMNPDFIEPEIPPVVVEAPPTPRELNAFYAAGHADGFKFYEDLKALVLSWATEQALSGGVADVDALPMVVYARHNP